MPYFTLCHYDEKIFFFTKFNFEKLEQCLKLFDINYNIKYSEDEDFQIESIVILDEEYSIVKNIPLNEIKIEEFYED